MGKKNKLKKFEELSSFSFVYENYNPKFPQLVRYKTEKVYMKGKWNELHFCNNCPIVLELACGRGEYTVALATEQKENNFIGVDIKGARLWKGAVQAEEQQLKNVAFLRTRIEQLGLFFGNDEVDEIWITFPDPFLRESKEKKRLTSERFFNIYKQVLKPNGIIHLKTDDDVLYEFTLETIRNYPSAKLLYTSDNIYDKELDFQVLSHKTYYEKAHLAIGKKIKYIRFIIH